MPELEEYALDKAFPLYEWDYGDTVHIPFDVGYQYAQCLITITIYNFRFEEVFSLQTSVNEAGQVELDIDAETSKEVFKQGMYYCRIQASSQEILLPSGSRYVATLLPATMCPLYVR